MSRKDEQQLLSALHVDLDPIDRLVEEGQYTSRADFLRAAIARLLEGVSETYTTVNLAPLFGWRCGAGQEQ
jgi:hypothetical protein